MEDKLEKEDWMLQPGVAAELMGLSEEEKDSIYRRYAAETDLQGQNIADANAVLQGPQSTGMTVGPGNLYVANAGGAIADGLRNFGAGRDRKAAKSELSNLATAEAGANKTTANVLGQVDKRNMGGAPQSTMGSAIRAMPPKNRRLQTAQEIEDERNRPRPA
tara:strand:+ start:380 stop:865 length:486 start_codon:yes stop_codon:yes gene_type:complete